MRDEWDNPDIKHRIISIEPSLIKKWIKKNIMR